MDSIRIFGYKSFKKLSVQLHPINLLIGANGAGKSNFLSLFEMLGNIYEKRLGAYVAQVGGVDKLLYQGRKVTDRIAVNLLIAKSEYDLALLEADGIWRLSSIVFSERSLWLIVASSASFRVWLPISRTSISNQPKPIWCACNGRISIVL